MIIGKAYMNYVVMVAFEVINDVVKNIKIRRGLRYDMNDINIEIPILSDNDGYVLLRCPNCGDLFKITPFDYGDESLLGIYCSSCGLIGDNYITEDVIELAISMTKNITIDIIYKEMKKQLNSGFISFKDGKKPKPQNEYPICAGIENLTITKFNCCKRYAKIKPILKISGCVCPFCGVKNFELE